MVGWGISSDVTAMMFATFRLHSPLFATVFCRKSVATGSYRPIVKGADGVSVARREHARFAPRSWPISQRCHGQFGSTVTELPSQSTNYMSPRQRSRALVDDQREDCSGARLAKQAGRDRHRPARAIRVVDEEHSASGKGHAVTKTE